MGNRRYSVFQPVALGIVLGLGIGAGALLGIGGIVGGGVCLLALGTAFWFAWDAEPCWSDWRRLFYRHYRK